jgi:hypothetical protein
MQTAPGTFFHLDRQVLSLMLRYVADSFGPSGEAVFYSKTVSRTSTFTAKEMRP